MIGSLRGLRLKILQALQTCSLQIELSEEEVLSIVSIALAIDRCVCLILIVIVLNEGSPLATLGTTI